MIENNNIIQPNSLGQPKNYDDPRIEELSEYLRSRGIDKPFNGVQLFEFPDGAIIPYLNKDLHLSMRTDRNRGLVSEEDQIELYNKDILVAGQSVGRSITRSLVVSGIGKKFTLIDPDHISATNLNRLGVDNDQLGKKKVVSSYEEFSKIDPYIEWLLLDRGYQTGDIDQRHDLVIDEMDDVRSKVLFSLEAREKGLKWAMATDLGGTVLVDFIDYKKVDKLFAGKISDKEAEILTECDLTSKDTLKFLRKIIGLKNILHEPDLVKAMFLLKRKELNGIPQLYSTVSKAGAAMTEISRVVLLDKNDKSSFRKVYSGINQPVVEKIKSAIEAVKIIKSK